MTRKSRSPFICSGVCAVWLVLAAIAAIPAQETFPPPPTEEPAAAPAGVTEGLVLHLVPAAGDNPGMADTGPYGIRTVAKGALRRVDLPGGASGLEFDGRTGCIELDSAPVLNSRGDLTLEVLAMVPAEVAAGFGMLVWRGDERSGHDPYSLGFSGGQLIFRRDLPKIIQVAWPAKGLDVTRPHVFAAVHRAYEEILELWVDGKRVAQGRISGNFRYETEGMRTEVGAMDGGRSQHFRGVIGRVKLYRRPLTPEELVAESALLLGP